MTDDTRQLQPPDAKPPPSFGHVAKRIRSRTTDLLAIAIIAVGGITVGTRVSGWFDDAPSPPQAAAESAGGSGLALGETDPVTLDFGSSPYSLHRVAVPGKRKTAIQRLLTICRERGSTASLPAFPAEPGERKLLAELADRKPVEERPDAWRLYRFDGPVTMATLTRPANPGDLNRDHADATRRVVCWGLAFPAGEERWTLYVFTSSTGALPGTEGLPELPLPGNVRPVLTIRAKQSAWRTFRTGESVADIRRFYESWFNSQGWSPQQSALQPGWTAVFVKGPKDGLRAEVRVSQEHNGDTSGVVFVTRPNRIPESK